MKLEYELTNEDFLIYQLYTSSKSELHKKKRNRSRIIIPIIYVLFGLYSYYNYKNLVGPIIWIGIALLWFILYPLYSRWRYKKHFEKHIEENYKNRVNQPSQLEFDSDFMDTKDFTSQSKIQYSELKEFIELPEHFLIKLASDLSIIIPKHAVDNVDGLKSKMSELKIEYVDETNWLWK